MFFSHPGGSWIFLNSRLRGNFENHTASYCWCQRSMHKTTTFHRSIWLIWLIPLQMQTVCRWSEFQMLPRMILHAIGCLYHMIKNMYIYITQPFLGSFRWHKITKTDAGFHHGITNLKVCRQSYGTTNLFHCKGETQSQGMRNFVPDDPLPHFST